MKVFVPQDWDSLKRDLEKMGKTIVLEKGETDADKGITLGDGKASIVAETNLYNLLDFLADSGYDFVALKNVESNFPHASTVDEVIKTPEYDSIKSLISKVKSTPGSERCGAIGIFVGFVREFTEDRKVVRLEYEKNEDIFDTKTTEIENKLKSYSGVVEARIFHRTGNLSPGEDIIYVLIMGEHRKDIWEPLEKSMDIIKEELPIWKKEVYVDGETWAHDTQYSKK